MLRLLIALSVSLMVGCTTPHGPSDSHLRAQRSSPKLNSALWIQGSAEYPVVTTQAFELAKLRLEQGLTDRTWSAALEQTTGYEALPPAVILDVDETVLDNAPFQSLLINRDMTFDVELWRAWVRRGEATAVPGAKDFVSYARRRGVAVFYVTNRTLETPTLDNLRRTVDPAVEAEDLLVQFERPQWGPNKRSRRTAIAVTHHILLLIGDDYNDFADLGRAPPASRVKQSKAHTARWGKQWIALPNPLYGSFERALYDYQLERTQRERTASKYRQLRTMSNPP